MSLAANARLCARPVLVFVLATVPVQAGLLHSVLLRFCKGLPISLTIVSAVGVSCAGVLSQLESVRSQQNLCLFMSATSMYAGSALRIRALVVDFVLDIWLQLRPSMIMCQEPLLFCAQITLISPAATRHQEQEEFMKIAQVNLK